MTTKLTTQLKIYADAEQPQLLDHLQDHDQIRHALEQIGVQFERWPLVKLESNDSDSVQQAYAEHIERLNQQYGFVAIDVASITADHPEKDKFRQMFLAEHTHADFEIRFFVAGSGLFTLHIEGKVYAVLCTAGDLISVPANTTHWFDMGTSPEFTAIRLFTTEEGWVGDFTGNDIAQRYPSFDEMVA